MMKTGGTVKNAFSLIAAGCLSILVATMDPITPKPQIIRTSATKNMLVPSNCATYSSGGKSTAAPSYRLKSGLNASIVTPCVRLQVQVASLLVILSSVKQTSELHPMSGKRP